MTPWRILQPHIMNPQQVPTGETGPYMPQSGMQSASLEFVNSVVEGLKILISWIPVIGGSFAFIGVILGFIFREWIKNWFARVAYERKLAGDKTIESHKADEALRRRKGVGPCICA